MHHSKSKNTFPNSLPSAQASNVVEPIDKKLQEGSSKLLQVLDYVLKVKPYVTKAGPLTFTEFCKVSYLMEMAYNNILHLKQEYTQLTPVSELTARFFNESGAEIRDDRISLAHMLNLRRVYETSGDSLKTRIKENFFEPVKMKTGIYKELGSSASTLDILIRYSKDIKLSDIEPVQIAKTVSSLEVSLKIEDNADLPQEFFTDLNKYSYSGNMYGLRGEVCALIRSLKDYIACCTSSFSPVVGPINNKIQSISDDIFNSLEMQSNLSIAIQSLGNNLDIWDAKKNSKEAISQDAQNIARAIVVLRGRLAHSETPILLSKEEVTNLLSKMEILEGEFNRINFKEKIELDKAKELAAKKHNTQFDALSIGPSLASASTSVTKEVKVSNNKGKSKAKSPKDDFDEILNREIAKANSIATSISSSEEAANDKELKLAQQIIEYILDNRNTSALEASWVSNSNFTNKLVKILKTTDGKIKLSTKGNKSEGNWVRPTALLIAYGSYQTAKQILEKYKSNAVEGNEGQVLRSAIENKNIALVKAILDLYKDRPEDLQKLLNSPMLPFSKNINEGESKLPLVCAVTSEQGDVAVDLIKNGASTEIEIISIGYTADGQEIEIKFTLMDKAVRMRLFNLIEYLVKEKNMPVDSIYSTDHSIMKGNFIALLESKSTTYAEEGYLVSLVRTLSNVGKLDLSKKVSLGGIMTLPQYCLYKGKFETVKELARLSSYYQFESKDFIAALIMSIYNPSYTKQTERSKELLEAANIFAIEKGFSLVEHFKDVAKTISKDTCKGLKEFLFSNLGSFPYICSLGLMANYLSRNTKDKESLTDAELFKIISAAPDSEHVDLKEVISNSLNKCFVELMHRGKPEKVDLQVLDDLLQNKSNIKDMKEFIFMYLKFMDLLPEEYLPLVPTIEDVIIKEQIEYFAAMKYGANWKADFAVVKPIYITAELHQVILDELFPIIGAQDIEMDID